MMIIDDKRPKDTTPPDSLKDPWADWKPSWTGRKETPHDLQERHSPTEQVSIRAGGGREVHKSQRRIVDARLWEAMSPAQQDAAVEIAAAFDMMGRGMGYVLSNWHRIPGCRSATNVCESHARLIKAYVEWAQKCAKAKISHAMVVDVLCFGFTCRMIDQDRQLRTGTTRQNLMDGLAFYAKLRGWRIS